MEDEGSKYGMKLNAKLSASEDKAPSDSQTAPLVPTCNESKYLGCVLNDKGDPKREVNKRIAECFLTWESLESFWKHSDCSVRNSSTAART